jgi:hypothetical protein
MTPSPSFAWRSLRRLFEVFSWLRAPWLRRVVRAGRLALPAIAAAYLLLLAFPDVLFAQQVTHGAFRVASDEPIDARIAAVLDAAAARLARSPLDDPRMEHRVYLCNTPLRWRLLAPLARGAYGTTYALSGHSVLAHVDIPANLAYREGPRYNRRPLDSLIAHERMHALMDRRYGVIACFRMPAWKKEGYCEFVAGHPSFDVEEGRRLIREGKEEDFGPFRYFRYYAMVKYLLDVERLSIDEVVSRQFDEAELMGKVRMSIDRLRF